MKKNKQKLFFLNSTTAVGRLRRGISVFNSYAAVFELKEYFL